MQFDSTILNKHMMQYLLPYDNNGDNTYKLSLPSLFSMEITNGL